MAVSNISAARAFITSKLKYWTLIKKDKYCGYDITDGLYSRLPRNPFNKEGWIFDNIILRDEEFTLDTFIRYMKLEVDRFITCPSITEGLILNSKKSSSELASELRSILHPLTDEEKEDLKTRVNSFLEKNKDKYQDVIKYFDAYSYSRDTDLKLRFYVNRMIDSRNYDLGDLCIDDDPERLYRNYIDLLWRDFGGKVLDELKKSSKLILIEKTHLSADHNLWSNTTNTEIVDWLKKNGGKQERDSYPPTSSVVGGNFTEYYYYGIILELGELRLATVVCSTRYNDFGGWN